MNPKPLKLITSVLGLCILFPIWYYLMYKILQLVGASEVMWLLYWIYVPMGILTAILGKIADWYD